MNTSRRPSSTALQAPVLAGLFLLVSLGGCLGGGGNVTIEPPLEDVEADALLAFLRTHAYWTVERIDAVVEHDPVAKHATSVSTWSIVNHHTAALTWFRFETALDVTSVTLEDGTPLEWRKHALSSAPISEDDVLVPIYPYNVTIPGAGAPGERYTLIVSAEGWEEALLYGAGSVGTEAPASDLNAFPQLSIVPLPEYSPTPPTITLTLTRPASWTYVLSAFPAGDLSPAEGATLTQTFEVQAGLVLFFVAKNLPALRETVDGVEVITHYHPDMLVQAEAVHAATKRALRFIPELTGPYPFPSITTVPIKMAVNAFSTPGVNALGLNFYRAVVPHVPHQFGRFAPWIAGSEQMEMVIVHEFTHNWWGHQLRNNNSNPNKGIRDAYITEGFTTYLSEIAYFAHVYGERDAAASVESKWRDQQADRATGTESPVTKRGDYYEKAALALRVLHSHYLYEGKEDAFLPTFTNMLEEFGLPYGGPGRMRHEDVIAAFSHTYGDDLTDFFKTWFEATDLPDIALTDVDANAATFVNRGQVPVPVEYRFRDSEARVETGWIYLGPGESQRIDPGLPGLLIEVHADPNWRLDEKDKANNVWGTASPVVPPA